MYTKKFSCMIFGSIISASFAQASESSLSDAHKAPHKITSLSYNIDTNIGKIEGPGSRAHETHDPWLFKNRMPSVLATLTSLTQEYSPDVVTIQETRSFTIGNTSVDSITPIQKHLQSLGYTTLIQPYCPSELAFSHATGFKSDRFNLASQKQLYLTKTPNAPTTHPDTTGMDRDQISKVDALIKDNNYGEYWERGHVKLQVHNFYPPFFQVLPESVPYWQ